MANDFHPFRDMKESAKAQHEVDKANFAAVRAESKAVWEEAKLSPKEHAKRMQAEREQAIAAAQARLDAVKAAKEG